MTHLFFFQYNIPVCIFRRVSYFTDSKFKTKLNFYLAGFVEVGIGTKPKFCSKLERIFEFQIDVLNNIIVYLAGVEVGIGTKPKFCSKRFVLNPNPDAIFEQQ